MKKKQLRELYDTLAPLGVWYEGVLDALPLVQRESLEAYSEDLQFLQRAALKFLDRLTAGIDPQDGLEVLIQGLVETGILFATESEVSRTTGGGEDFSAIFSQLHEVNPEDVVFAHRALYPEDRLAFQANALLVYTHRIAIGYEQPADESYLDNKAFVQFMLMMLRERAASEAAS